MFNLGITIYSLDALYRSAFILGIIETIFIRPKMNFFGMFIDLAVQTIVLGITSACVKGLKLHWSDGYLVVALGALTVFATKYILQYLLILTITAFVN